MIGNNNNQISLKRATKTRKKKIYGMKEIPTRTKKFYSSFPKRKIWNCGSGQEREEIIKYRTKKVRVFWEKEGRFVVV